MIPLLLYVFIVTTSGASGVVSMREKAGHLCYDGDTCYVQMFGLPEPLGKLSVRLGGMDTPEKRGKCAKEKEAALKARDFLEISIKLAHTITLVDAQWDKYGGRIRGDLFIDGKPFAEKAIKAGHARPYNGGKRKGWCD